MSVNFIAQSRLPTAFGDFTILAFEDSQDKKEHIALVMGKLDTSAPVLTRVHSECLTGDALFSLRCDCGSQLNEAMQRIADNGSGLILYLRQEGRAIGLANKIRAYELQDAGADTVDANIRLGFEPDERTYDICQSILEYLGVTQVDLMTNNPLKVDALESLGIRVNQRLPIIAGENTHNAGYLAVKRSKMGHIKE